MCLPDPAEYSPCHIQPHSIHDGSQVIPSDISLIPNLKGGFENEVRCRENEKLPVALSRYPSLSISPPPPPSPLFLLFLALSFSCLTPRCVSVVSHRGVTPSPHKSSPWSPPRRAVVRRVVVSPPRRGVTPSPAWNAMARIAMADSNA